MSKAEIQFAGFDPATGAPSYEIDCGTNTSYRLDVTTVALLFEPGQDAARQPRNFWTSGFVALPAGGTHRISLPAAAWSTLDKGGRLFHRLTTRSTTGGDLRRSLELGAAGSAPSFSTAAPTVDRLAPASGPSAGGTVIRIEGTGLGTAQAVRFAALAIPFRVLDDGALEITSPAAAAQPSPAVVVVETRFGTSSGGGQATFQYEAASLPAIVSPAPGTVLTSSDVPFTWSAHGGAIDEWWLCVECPEGSTRETRPVSPASLTETSGLVEGLPLDGRAVEAQLWYRTGEAWSQVTAGYTMAVDPAFVQARQQTSLVLAHHVLPVSDDDVEVPAEHDLLVLIHGNRAAVLPASWNLVTQRAAAPPVEPVAVATFPTIGKEGFYLVHVGGRVAYAMDAGGARKVVFPHAMGLALESLGVARVDGVILKHIDADHVRSFLHLVEHFGLFPRNIHFSDAFVAGTAEGATLATMYRTITSAFPNAPFGVIPTPAPGTGSVFSHTLHRDHMTFELVGHTEVFGALKALRLTGAPQRLAGIRRLRDTAIPMVRMTHEPSGLIMLDITDLRGADLSRYEQAMGRAAFSRFVGGATVIIGFQHHMGALDPATTAAGRADRAGLVRLLSETYLQSGRLEIIVQSRATPEDGSGSFRLNRSLVRVLRDLGIDVHLALDGAPGSVGTLNLLSDGRVVHRGGGGVDTGGADRAARRAAAALGNLRMLRVLSETYAGELAPGLRATVHGIGPVSEAYERTWARGLEIVLGCVASRDAAAQPVVADAAQYQAALAELRAIPFELLAMSSLQIVEAEETLRVLRVRDELRGELARVRQTSRITGFTLRSSLRLLRQLTPAHAGAWLDSSNLERRERERLRRMLNLERPPTAARIAHLGLLALVVATEVVRWMPVLRARWYQRDVKPFLEAIVWWQHLGIQPEMKGLDDSALQADEITTDPARIAALAHDDELDAVALTGLPAAGDGELSPWDVLAIRLSMLVGSYLDWSYYVGESPAIRLGDHGYEYKVGDIVETLTDYDVTERWIASPELTAALAAIHARVRETTTEDIQALRFGPGPDGGPSFQDPDYPRHDTYAGKPRPLQVARFRPELPPDQRRLFTPGGGQYYRHYPDDACFYVFPAAMSPEPIDDDYLVVGGANFDTYAAIIESPVVTSIHALDPQGKVVPVGVKRRPNRSEVMWARPGDLVIEPLE